jgi:hypothetical protein
MTEALDHSALQRWQREPVTFIEQVLRDPETGRPFVLMDWQREFFAHAYQTNSDGRLRYPEQLAACPKKTGKTTFAGLHLLTTTLIYGGRFAEGFCVANDLEQAQGRVYQAVRRIVEASPHLKREAEITATRCAFPQTGACIAPVGGGAADQAGANPTISSFDELWGYVSERSRRLWDEMIPSPARKISCRSVTTYAGFSGESTLLEELYKRGQAQPLIGDDLHAGDGLLAFLTNRLHAPWQTDAWVSEVRKQLRPNQFVRMIENRFTAGEESFVTAEAWDRIVRPGIGSVPSNPLLPIWIGVDASVKRDSSAIVAVTYANDVVRLVYHRIFTPSPDDPIDFESDIEACLLSLSNRFSIRRIVADPYQMVSTMQRLTKQGLPVQEFPQTVPNLTAASQQLYELIQGQSLVCYANEALRTAITRCVAIEGTRGWHIGKHKQSHKIDVVIALAMACHAAVQGQNASTYTLVPFDPSYVDLDVDPAAAAAPTAAQRASENAADYVRAYALMNGLIV